GSSPADAEERLEAHLRAERRRGFRLSRAPLMRLALIRTADGGYRFIWSHHHILLDGWSSSLLLGEVFGFYEAVRANRPVEAPPPRPFREYIAWLERQDLSAAERYWRGALRGFTTPTPLGLDLGPDTLPREEQESHWTDELSLSPT